MDIKTYLNTTKEEVESKKFNIWIGISLGNKYFTEEHIRDYILWALDYTKDKVVVLIADKIHSVNYEVRNEYTEKRALSMTMRKGAEVKEVVAKIIKNLPKSEQKRIEVLSWKDIEDINYEKQKNILFKEFNTNKKFYNNVIKIVRESVKDKKLNIEDYKKLSQYVLNELPVFIDGVTYRNYLYNLIIYPGLNEIDYLALDLNKNKRFPSISKKLNVKNEVAILEAYAK